MKLTDLPNLSVSQDEMDAWAHTCGRANYALLQTLEALAQAGGDTQAGDNTDGEDTQAGDNTQDNPQIVVERLHSAAVAINTLLQFLVRAGAARPAHAPVLPPQPTRVPTGADRDAGLEQVPAAVLPRLDTPAARRLLALLRAAQEVAGDVDGERYGQAGNAGWAEAIEKLAFPLSVEIHGPPKALEPHP